MTDSFDEFSSEFSKQMEGMQKVAVRSAVKVYSFMILAFLVGLAAAGAVVLGLLKAFGVI